MAHDEFWGKNKHAKVHSKYHVYTSYDPKDAAANNIPAELEAELLDYSQSSRRQFRRSAQRL